MGCTIRDIDPAGTFSQVLTVDALHQAIPADAITQVIAQEGVKEDRLRSLTTALTVWIVIALHLFPTVSISGVLRKLARGLRLLWPDPETPLPGDRAIASRRRHLGARPLVALFNVLCRPLATPQTRGAFQFGLRLMALDGTCEDGADTSANARAFGRQRGSRGVSAFPLRWWRPRASAGRTCAVACPPTSPPRRCAPGRMARCWRGCNPPRHHGADGGGRAGAHHHRHDH